jgi:DNA polymerase-3 subunit gamma/tau
MPSESTHLVLARKYRPQKFRDVVEQATAVRALQNAMLAGRIGSAYLFFGPRGVGKTTIARILAKRVNCESPVENEPCDACESCKGIRNGYSMDVIEIDAASHRGIDYVRELRENVKFRPMQGKKKVYIIDEVHMLTNESFNALLKTLEEPPEHVLFVLATTEFNKIPETILSRCQVFTFRKVPLGILQRYLGSICRSEGIEADEEALFWIARRGDGSVRDSLSFMEQAITYCGKHIGVDQVKELTGAIYFDLFISLTKLILSSATDPEALMKPVHNFFVEGGDMNRFIWEYLDFLRMAVHIRNGSEDPEFLGIPGPEIAKIQQEFDATDPVRLNVIFQSIYGLLSRSFALRLRNSYETRVLIEMELLALREKLLAPSLSGIIQKLNRLSASPRTAHSPENELQKRFLGTVVDPNTMPELE